MNHKINNYLRALRELLEMRTSEFDRLDENEQAIWECAVDVSVEVQEKALEAYDPEIVSR